MVDVAFYSTVGFLCAFAPNLTRVGHSATALRHRNPFRHRAKHYLRRKAA
jgi:hypothetical protein